jgi:hypothetical protein
MKRATMTNPTDNPCLQEARRFFDLLYPHAPHDWLLVFVKSKGYPWTKWFRPDQRDALLAYMVENGQKYDTFVGIGTRRNYIPRKRGHVEDITAIPGVWMDIDIHGEAHKNAKLPHTDQEVLDLLSDFLEPSVIVHTGHGLYVYWLFEKLWAFQSDEERDYASRVLNGFQVAIKEQARQRGWVLDTTSDLSRTLRVPGSFNFKVRPKEAVRIYAEAEVRYSPEDFEAYAEASPLSRSPSSGSLDGVEPICFTSPQEGAEAEKLEPLARDQWDNDKLIALLTTPEREWQQAHWLGVPEGVRLGENHPCLLHPDDRNPSGVLTYDQRTNAFMYWCNHHEARGLKERTYTLPVLWCAQVSGVSERLKRATIRIWRLRLAGESGCLVLPEIPHRPMRDLAPDASTEERKRHEAQRKVYEGFILVCRCHALTDPGRDVIYTAPFAARWSGLLRDHYDPKDAEKSLKATEKAAKDAINDLCDSGLMLRTREHQGIREPALYRPGDGTPHSWAPPGDEEVV